MFFAADACQMRNLGGKPTMAESVCYVAGIQVHRARCKILTGAGMKQQKFVAARHQNDCS
jgi:hypothetical protein